MEYPLRAERRPAELIQKIADCFLGVIPQRGHLLDCDVLVNGALSDEMIDEHLLSLTEPTGTADRLADLRLEDVVVVFHKRYHLAR